ncbi:DUF4395 family protein [Candidatus Peregrinibacteria bacterium]|nr:MAG: DUF4395 family protein [Candidatus Peregrinibacteria bacterium]
MKKACPLSAETVNSVQVRFVAGGVMIIAFSLVITPNILIATLLTVDFFLRGFVRRFSLLGCTARVSARFLGIGKKINAGPKQFAAKLGFFFSAGIFLSLLFGAFEIASFFAILLVFAAGLEAIFGFCLGCYIFPLWVHVRSFRVPKKYANILGSALMSVIMAFLMSGVLTFFNLGAVSFFVSIWMKSFLKSIFVAFPVILLVRPLVEKLVRKMVI